LLTRDALLDPKCLSSPRIRSAPQVAFSRANRLMRAMSSSESGGLPGLDSAFDLCLQTKRKTSRCQRSKVSGCTIIKTSFHTYLGHVDRLERFIQALELTHLTLFVQDWGSLIGLRVVGTHPDWFDRVIVGNGFLPVFEAGSTPFKLPSVPQLTRRIFYRTIMSIPPQQPVFYDAEGNLQDTRFSSASPGTFGVWIDYARNDKRFVASQIVEAMTYFPLSDAERAAYDAPFPSRLYMGGPRAFPGLVNQLPGVTQAAWEALGRFEKPFLTIWGGNDPGNLGRPMVQQALLDHIPGTAGWDHVRLLEASHFLQDDQGAEIARRVNDFVTQSGG
jgi:pimeloyl-ACP methyl ester carboxylesterase